MTQREQPQFGKWMGSMWLFTVLRFGLFFVLWAMLYALGVRSMHGYAAPLIALVLSVPLSFVLLARPRAAFTRQLELRLAARRAGRERLDADLDPDTETDSHTDSDAQDVDESGRVD